LCIELDKLRHLPKDILRHNFFAACLQVTIERNIQMQNQMRERMAAMQVTVNLILFESPFWREKFTDNFLSSNFGQKSTPETTVA
jgi:hypothetical protein